MEALTIDSKLLAKGLNIALGSMIKKVQSVDTQILQMVVQDKITQFKALQL